jgi:hypothetical protein
MIDMFENFKKNGNEMRTGHGKSGWAADDIFPDL